MQIVRFTATTIVCAALVVAFSTLLLHRSPHTPRGDSSTALFPGAGQVPTTTPVEEQMGAPDVQIIDFAREIDGVFDHVTITANRDGTQYSWTVSKGSDKQTTSGAVTTGQFGKLWDPLNAPVFQRYYVRQQTTRLDFRANYVVGLIYNVNGQAGSATYLIPDAEQDPTWTDWLAAMKSLRRRG